jgi:hypothetical protein
MAAPPLAAPAPASLADASDIVGTWVSKNGPERLVIEANGRLHTCYSTGRSGNAAMGWWRVGTAGHYKVEFTAASTASCQGRPTALRMYHDSVVGQATLSKGELALFIGGESPPDVYVRATAR